MHNGYGSGWGVCVLSQFSHVQLFATLWTIAHQIPLSMGFSKQEYWSGLPCPPPGLFLTQGLSLRLLCLLLWQVGSLPLAPPEQPFTLVPGGTLTNLQHQMRRKETLKLAKGFLHQGCRKETFALSLTENLSLKRWLRTLTSYPPKNK